MHVDTTDLRLLRIFLTIAESGGFAAAQGELNLSLPTISSHMATLESRLGLTLCRRGRGGFALTTEGNAVYEEARHLFQALDRFEQRARALRNRLSGTLTLGVVDNTITDPNLPLEAVFARFAQEAPEVVVSITTRPPSELLRDVVSRQLQIAIGSFPRIALGLDYTDLHTERQNLYCGRRHPLFDTDDADITVELAREHRIVARSYWGMRDMKLFAIAAPRAVVSDMESTARLILSGAYLGYLPDHYAAADTAAGRLRPIRPDLFGVKALFQAATAPEAREEPIVALFLNLLAAEMRGAGVSPAAASPPRPAQ
ncbi:LysR family transcriptional regulator [Azospirillum sp. TSO35-2]|uniref:LysR family transcriptional regulator n=1 Tax=Azospirillum sp. TSO35-2 TaxID=716796 RepID=UPI000D60A50D|nr:LysR family transcriptional regulator [Azospirillum sp. TSO35-2]PWC38972.1 transcriptional regulator [Azospirillum sp. TSO35-2]